MVTSNTETVANEPEREGLRLCPAGRLEHVRWVYDEEAEQGQYVARDVTDQALAYLFEPVTLADGVVVRDLFLLCRDQPELQAVLQRDWCSEYVAAAFAQPEPPIAQPGEPEAMEYVEVYQLWTFDSKTKEYGGLERWDLHGIGYPMPADDPAIGVKAGARVNYGLSLMPPHEMLGYPLRIRREVKVCEDNSAAKNYGAVLDTVLVPPPTLGDLLHSVFWEISFHGGPEDTEAFAVELQRRVDSIPNATIEDVDNP